MIEFYNILGYLVWGCIRKIRTMDENEFESLKEEASLNVGCLLKHNQGWLRFGRDFIYGQI